MLISLRILKYKKAPESLRLVISDWTYHPPSGNLRIKSVKLREEFGVSDDLLPDGSMLK